MNNPATDGRGRARWSRHTLGLSLVSLLLLAAPAGAQASSYAQRILETPSLDHYWRLGETSGLKAYDAEGGPDGDGDYGEQVELGRRGAIARDRNKAAGFAGGLPDQVWESHVKTGASPQVWGLGSFTWEAWVKPGLLDDRSRRILSAEDVSGGVLLAARASGVVLSRHIKAGTRGYYTPETGSAYGPVTARATTVRAPLAAGVWSHVVGTFNGTTMRLYVNGKLEASGVSTLFLNSISSLTIGSEGRKWLEWDGDLDELATYRGALDPDDVLEHYQAGIGCAPRGARKHHRGHRQGHHRGHHQGHDGGGNDEGKAGEDERGDDTSGGEDRAADDEGGAAENASEDKGGDDTSDEDKSDDDTSGDLEVADDD
jgi:hypothetical protein